MHHKVENIKEMNRSYLVLRGEENCTETDFQMRMAAEAEIPVFVKVQIRQIDCHLEYYYHISGKVVLNEWLQHRLISRKELQALFQALFQAYEAVEAYLLDADRIVLHPSCIVVNGEGREPQFCYGTEGEHSFSENLQELMQYLLTRLNHSDEETVRVGYTLYQYCRQEQCVLGEMLQVFETGRGQDTWGNGLSNQYPAADGEDRKEACPDTLWDSQLPVVLSREEAEEKLLSSGEAGVQKSAEGLLEHKSQAGHVSGWQWLLISVLSGVFALLGGIYCLAHKPDSGQGGMGLLLIGIVLLVAVCLWGIYWFYRENRQQR